MEVKLGKSIFGFKDRCIIRDCKQGSDKYNCCLSYPLLLPYRIIKENDCLLCHCASETDVSLMHALT